MKTINLRDYYPEIYNCDHPISIPDAIYKVLRESELAEAAYRLRTYRHKAYYSLDYGDNIEREALIMGLSPYDEFEQKLTEAQLYAALSSLPVKQQRRIYAHFFLDMSKAAIARVEGVAVNAVKDSIARGLISMNKYFEKNC
jgi:RNA polymerase sigma-70 factor (ECF subfamily)